MTTVSTIQEPQTHSKARLNFSDGNREAHLQAFFAWLPEVLHQAPGINWSALSSKIIGYGVLTIADSPDKMCIALAMGTAIGAIDQSTLHSYTYRIVNYGCQVGTIPFQNPASFSTKVTRKLS
jgi:hypothetical protein